MKRYRLACGIIVALLVSTIGISAGFADDIVEMRSIDVAMPIEPETPIVRNIRPIRTTIDGHILPVDTQITNSPEDETHLSCAIDVNGNPFVIYDKVYDISSSTLGTQLSSDKGANWPEDLAFEWTLEDMYAKNPDISMLSDGIFAFGTFETGWQDPQVNMLNYVDINDPETWQITFFDRSDRSSYVSDTAATTKGQNTLAVACITDYDTGEQYMIDTIVINWNCYRGEDSWPGVIFYNTDTEGISQPLSHLTADAGEKIIFCAEQEKTDGSRSIRSYYCNVTEVTEYTDWKAGVVAGGKSNCTYPDVSVSDKLAYCVYMDDKNGNQDIYVATTTTGGSWIKYVVTNSTDDELYPVISANGNEATCMFMKNNNVYVTKTEDAGKTWSDPAKVNDDMDSVVSEFGSIDITGAYGFWASNKEGNNDIFFEEVGQFSEVVITEISGGFGTKATLSNIGNADAQEVTWSISLTGGLVIIGSETSGTVNIPAGESVTISPGFIFAIGKITISVTVGTAIKTASGFALGPFVLNVV